MKKTKKKTKAILKDIKKWAKTIRYYNKKEKDINMGKIMCLCDLGLISVEEEFKYLRFINNH